MSSISYDEFDNGNAFLFSLPITRKDYVLEKYIFGSVSYTHLDVYKRQAWAFLNVAQGETLSNKLVRAGRAMQAGVYFVTQSSGDVSKESLKNNIGLKFAFRSTDINEIKQTLEFFGIDKDDENNQKDVYKRQQLYGALFFRGHLYLYVG